MTTKKQTKTAKRKPELRYTNGDKLLAALLNQDLALRVQADEGAKTANAGQNREKFEAQLTATNIKYAPVETCPRVTQGKPDASQNRVGEISPLPWKASCLNGWMITDAAAPQNMAGNVAHLTGRNEAANAKLIVASVNNADKLAKALRRIELRSRGGDGSNITLQRFQEWAQETAEQALADWEASKQ